MKNYIQILGVVSLLHIAVSCASEVNKVVVKIPDDFRGPITVRAVATEEQLFDGMLIPDQNGLILVSEKGFWNWYRLSARRENGDKIKIGRLSDEADGATYAFWELPAGAFAHYFYVGKREDMESWYASNYDKLFRIPEDRLKRNGYKVEMIVPDSEDSWAAKGSNTKSKD